MMLAFLAGVHGNWNILKDCGDHVYNGCPEGSGC